jgi:hypothetical protein
MNYTLSDLIDIEKTRKLLQNFFEAVSPPVNPMQGNVNPRGTGHRVSVGRGYKLEVISLDFAVLFHQHYSTL